MKSRVAKVEQFEVGDDGEALEIMNRFKHQDLGSSEIPHDVLDYITGKKYAMFVQFDSVEKIKPFAINKAGFGAMCSWITVNDVESIKV